MSKLLIEEPPLQVLPSLAKAIGLNEAIAVQQVHYWMTGKSGKIFEGKRWIYNSYPKWQEQFPFWSKATIQRTFASAEAQGVLISRQDKGFNRQKHYTIDYEHLESSIISKCDDPQPQIDTIPSYQNDTVLTEREYITENVVEKPPQPKTTAKHLVIQTIREITKRYPPTGMYDTLIKTIGDNPNAEKLKACYVAWCGRGYNPTALTWALDWYKSGIPASGKSSAPAKDPNFRRRPRPEILP